MGKCVVHTIQPDRKMVGMVGDIKVSVSDLEAQSGGRWLPCDGRLIDQKAYPELYAASEVSFETRPAVVEDRLTTGSFTATVGGVTEAFTLRHYALTRQMCFCWAENLNRAALFRLVDGDRWVLTDGVVVNGQNKNGFAIYPLSPEVILAMAWENPGTKACSFLSTDGGVGWQKLNTNTYLVAPLLIEESGVPYILAIGNTFNINTTNSGIIYAVRVRLSDGDVAQVNFSAIGGTNFKAYSGTRCSIAYQNGEYVFCIPGYTWMIYGKLTNGSLSAISYTMTAQESMALTFQGKFICGNRQNYTVFTSPFGSAKTISNALFSGCYGMIPYRGKLLKVSSSQVWILTKLDETGYAAEAGPFTLYDMSPEVSAYNYSDVEQMGIPFHNGHHLCCKWKQLPIEKQLKDGRKTFILAK